ncbi:hypothetical protein [Pseudoalteromonas luteoviolacea]|nr:hypothetical protein [Pseudoalteromonas luteoviolacea]
MKILNTSKLKAICGGLNGSSPDLPHRSMANLQPNKAQKTPSSIKKGIN